MTSKAGLIPLQTLNYQNSGFQTLKFETSLFGEMDELKDFYALYKPGLSFSEDNGKFIDIYSYWLNLSKNGNKVFEQPRN